jgi:rhodanese-related sulfurtransferase
MDGDDQLEITRETLKDMLTQPHRPFEIIDCRERMELGRGIIPGSKVIPMSELQRRLEEIDRHRPVIVYCEHGVRSLNVAAYLSGLGIMAQSLSGGFAAWDGERASAEPRDRS